jgi:hypothetical protein
MIAEDSAKFWFPKLTAHSWQWMRDWLPQTVIIDYDEMALAESLHGKYTAEYERLYYAVQSAIETNFQCRPVFIRTDITSAKHAGKHAYKVSDYDGLNDALLTTLSCAELKSYHSKIKSSAIMVRPWLDIKHNRTAFGGLPIGREWRVFADQRGVQCAHGYWPEEALDGHMDDGQPPSAPSADWSRFWMPSDRLQVNWNRGDIADAAAQAAKAMGQLKWSVDFAEDVNGEVWLLDMATAMNSFHTPECKFAGLDNFERV